LALKLETLAFVGVDLFVLDQSAVCRETDGIGWLWLIHAANHR